MLTALLKRKVLFIYLPLAIHWISIFILTSMPSNSMPEFALHDKAKHFTAYLVLSFLLSLSLRVQNRYKMYKENFVNYTLIISLFYSTFDEIHQIFIPGRSAEFLDWIANLIGIILGLYLSIVFIKKVRLDDIDQTGTESK